MMRLTWQVGDNTYLLTLDAVTTERHTLTQNVTEHPVEQGASLVDHIRPLPVAISLEGVITNTPLYLPPDHTDGAQIQIYQVDDQPQTVADAINRHGGSPGVGAAIALPGLVGGLVSTGTAALASLITLQGKRGQFRSLDRPMDRHRAVYQTLLQLRAQGTLLTLESELSIVTENLALVEATCDRQTSGHLRVSMSLRQIQSAVVTVVAAPTPAVSTKVKPKVRVEAKPAEAEEPQPLESLVWKVRH